MQNLEDRLVQHCLTHNLLREDHINIARIQQQEDKRFLGNILIDLQLLPKPIFNDALIKITGYGLMPECALDLKVFGGVPVAIAEDKTEIKIGVKDPTNITFRDLVRQKLAVDSKRICWYHFFGGNKNQSTLRADSLNLIMKKALKYNASDIHLTPKGKIWSLVYRVNGVLTPEEIIEGDEMMPLMIRLKVATNLDITNTKTAQSGKFEYHFQDQPVQCRFSTHPTIYGEKIAIRILYHNNKRRGLADLGVEENAFNDLKKLLTIQEGLIIFCGPTGSGKTTTQYALLDAFSKNSFHIATLEDPVESFLTYAAQTEISPRFSYADGVRSLMRQDPDIILIGEIRDEDTAKMALRAATTGHLVLSSMHARSHQGVIDRFISLGCQLDLVKSYLKAVVSQTLEPVSCGCNNKKTCSDCYGTGYKNRRLQMTVQR